MDVFWVSISCSSSYFIHVLCLLLSVDLDLCANNPCQNGGTCNLMESSKKSSKKKSKEAEMFTYTCDCLLGFDGDDCESECTVFHSTFMINTLIH